MKRVLSVLAVALLVAGIGYKVSQDPFFERYKSPLSGEIRTTSEPVAPAVATGFFSALCARNSEYLAANMGGSLTSTEEELDAYFVGSTTQCFGFRYLGALTSPAGYQQYIAVLEYGPDGETWYVATVEDGLVIGLE
jgi:hypothetical protein